MRLFVLSQIILALFSSMAHAQYFGATAGIGMYGGMPNCSVEIPEGIKAIEDDVNDLQREDRELRGDIRDLESDKRKDKRELDKAEAAVRRVLKDESSDINVFSAVKALYENPGTAKATITSACTGEATARQQAPWTGFCPDASCGAGGDSSSQLEQAASPSCIKDEAKYWSDQWVHTDATNAGNICRNTVTGGAVSKMIKAEYNGPNSESARAACTDGIKFMINGYSKVKLYDIEIAAKKKRREEIKDELKRLRKDKREEMQDIRERMADGEEVEADFCYSCTYGNQRKLSVADRVGGILSTALVGAATYYGTKYTVDQNKRLGWPTSPWMAYGMGYPFLMAGIYGAAAGGGAGAYGCSGSGGGMGGPFGYPPWMYGGGMGGMGGGMGGGMFMGGVPYAGGMYGMPAAGMFMGGVGGMFAGGGAFPGMYAGGMYAGMPMAGGGMFMGGVGGMFMGGGAFPGMYMGGMGGGMAPFSGFGAPFATYGMPMPMASAMGGGGFPMAGGGMFMGGVGGMFMGGGAMMPMAGGMYAGMPMAGGGMFMGGGGFPGMYMGGSMAAMQYQQQMMNMYQQQMQTWISEQQRMAQDYQNRTAIVGRLQGELYRIQMQIQQISSGGYGYSGGASGGFGYGGGVGGMTGNILPYPGDPNYQPATTGTIPARGRGYNP